MSVNPHESTSLSLEVSYENANSSTIHGSYRKAAIYTGGGFLFANQITETWDASYARIVEHPRQSNTQNLNVSFC